MEIRIPGRGPEDSIATGGAAASGGSPGRPQPLLRPTHGSVTGARHPLLLGWEGIRLARPMDPTGHASVQVVSAAPSSWYRSRLCIPPGGARRNNGVGRNARRGDVPDAGGP